MNRNERIRILASYPLVVNDQSAIEEAVIGAISDMKKLEKIEQIMQDYQLYPMDCLFYVKEVLEDGNNN